MPKDKRDPREEAYYGERKTNPDDFLRITYGDFNIAYCHFACLTPTLQILESDMHLDPDTLTAWTLRKQEGGVPTLYTGIQCFIEHPKPEEEEF